MKQITLEELLEAGCHFGHQVNRRNPKADDFIYEARSNINIINLEKTLAGLIKAGEFIKDLSGKDGHIIIVGTKRQATTLVQEETERALKEGAKGIYYVNSRWVGGIITNFEEVAKNFKKLNDLRKFLSSENNSGYTKKEILLLQREKEKLEKLYAGIADLEKIPDALFIIDTHHEDTAVREALRTGVKIAGIVDTNADPYVVDYPIPANDDAIGSLKLIVTYIVDAWIEGKKLTKANGEEVKKDKNTEKKDIVDEKVELKGDTKETSVRKSAKKVEKNVEVPEKQIEKKIAKPAKKKD